MSSDGIVKVLNALPISKLISTVSAGIGKMYEPRHKRKMADATAYEINAIGEAMRNVADMPIVYNQDGVAINSEDFNRLMQRAGTRLVLQETIKQHNIESVVDNAYEILEKEEVCSEEPVEQGWINRFFDSVADVSDEDLQKLWGKILADEIKRPKSYSLRTLETLRNLSKEEAVLFRKICTCRIATKKDSFLLNDTVFLQRHRINYGEILQLSDCGLLNSSGFITRDEPVNKIKKFIFCNKELCLLAKTKNNMNFSLKINNFPFTSAGHELAKVLELEIDNDAFLNFARKLKRENDCLEFTVSHYLPFSENTIEAADENLL